MSLQDVFGAALLEGVGQVARARGYSRARRVWSRSNERGDRVAFDVQSSAWNSAGSLRCIVNVGAAPAPWLDFEAAGEGRTPTRFSSSDGIFRSRIGPSARGGSERWWQIESPAEAQAVAADIASRMERQGWSLLEDLLDRQRMLERIRSGRMGFFGGECDDRWLAVVLADDGPSAELDEALSRASSWLPLGAFAELRTWCDRRAQGRID